MAATPPKLRIVDLRPGVLDAEGRERFGKGRWSLAVDRQSGWVHWRRRGGGINETESFSPDRLRKVRIAQVRSFVPWSKCWRVILMMDHPRIPKVILMQSSDRKLVEATAKDLAGALQIDIA